MKMGLWHVCKSRIEASKEPLSVLEIGFGTGLNALITLIEAEKLERSIDYTGVEAYPVEKKEVNELNYTDELSASVYNDVFLKLHQTTWEETHDITTGFRLTKRKQFFSDITDCAQHDLIYFDAFGARVQPELWTPEIFGIMFKALRNNGVLVTYSAKGSVRRAMEEVGFTVERLPGPPGKREMLRATKAGN